jgi:hypothetical protein
MAGTESPLAAMVYAMSFPGRGAILPKPNYEFAKRQRDLAKKQKKEAKRQRKAEAGQATPATGAGESPPPTEKTAE